MAYIDAELAKRNTSHRHQSRREDQFSSLGLNSASSLELTTQSSLLPDGRQPASLGRIHEIDLGPGSKERNIAATEAATHRGQMIREGKDPDAESGEAEQPRLRRDGKPFRRRKRRTSADIKRDQLVEEVLRESRLKIYEDEKSHSRKGNESRKERSLQYAQSGQPDALAAAGAVASSSDSATDSDAEAADDALAEQFRRDFLEQVQARRRQRQPAPGSAAAKAAREKKNAGAAAGADGAGASRGPKLGGSRSARAKVRERALEEAKAGAGGSKTSR